MVLHYFGRGIIVDARIIDILAIYGRLNRVWQAAIFVLTGGGNLGRIKTEVRSQTSDDRHQGKREKEQFSFAKMSVKDSFLGDMKEDFMFYIVIELFE